MQTPLSIQQTGYARSTAAPTTAPGATPSQEWSEGPQPESRVIANLELPPDELQLSQAAQHDLMPSHGPASHGPASSSDASSSSDGTSENWSPEASSLHDEMSGLQRSLQAALMSGNKQIAGRLMSRLAQCQSEFASLTGG
jgi:hypothetical protein